MFGAYLALSAGLLLAADFRTEQQLPQVLQRSHARSILVDSDNDITLYMTDV